MLPAGQRSGRASVPVLCHHEDATALGCQATATSTGLAAACPSRDQRPGGARCGMRGSPCPRDRPCERPAAALRPGGDPTVTGVPTHPSRRPHGATRPHNPCPDRTRDTLGLAQHRCRMQGATKPDIRRSRRLARVLAANPRAAIYGTIVASAVIATTAGGHQPAELILEATLATLVIFWLAHVYADFLGHGLRHARSNLRLLASIMVQELSMLVAPALSILFLLLGALGVLEEALAVGLALWNDVVQLVGWGIAWDADADKGGRRHCSQGWSTAPSA